MSPNGYDFFSQAMLSRYSISAILLAVLLTGYTPLLPVAQTGYLYAVDHLDAQHLYIARRLDGSGLKQGRDYLCNATPNAVCVVRSKDTIPANRRLLLDRVKVMNQGRFVELDVTRK